METQYSKLRDMVGIGALALLAAVGWFFVYVQPADEMRYEIMECMGDDMSRISYDGCMEDLRASE